MAAVSVACGLELLPRARPHRRRRTSANSISPLLSSSTSLISTNSSSSVRLWPMLSSAARSSSTLMVPLRGAARAGRALARGSSGRRGQRGGSGERRARRRGRCGKRPRDPRRVPARPRGPTILVEDGEGLARQHELLLRQLRALRHFAVRRGVRVRFSSRCLRLRVQVCRRRHRLTTGLTGALVSAGRAAWHPRSGRPPCEGAAPGRPGPAARPSVLPGAEERPGSVHACVWGGRNLLLRRRCRGCVDWRLVECGASCFVVRHACVPMPMSCRSAYTLLLL
jgi:hypothetical protein